MEYDFTYKLLSAASKGHTNGAAMLIEHGVDVNLKDNDGMTALMWAAREGHTDAVAMLIDKGSDVNSSIKQEKFRKLSIAALATGILGYIIPIITFTSILFLAF